MNSKSSPSTKKPAERKPGRKNNSKRLLAVLLVVLCVGLIARFGLQKMESDRVDAAIVYAQSAASQGRWAEAEAACQEWATMRPGDSQAWEMAAEMAMGRGDLKAAEAYLLQLPEDAPAEALHKLGFLQMEGLKDPLAAKATCDETIRRFPGDAETHERLLYYYVMTGQRSKIRPEVDRAIANNSDTLASYAYLFAAKWLTFTNGYKTNQAWLELYPDEEAFQVASVLHLPSYALTDVLAKEAHPEEEAPRPLAFIAERIRELRKQYPSNVELLAIETRDLCRAGNVPEVANRLANTPDAAKQDNRFWRFNGWYNSANDQWGPAKDAYRTALQIDPFDWSSRLELAQAIRASEGVAAAESVQDLAMTGQRLMSAIQKCPDIRRLEPASLYDELASYFRDCGQPEIADQLRACMQRSL
ncbi:MAG: hypothetical protein AAGG44_08550 [Planctomycetota bacterium]